ncbi:MAG: twin-arginine translocase TatA/TatE family subunit [Planctomycetes bacterium]|nr:twin-arginine translocase TatA/TatE family subunit [Planctomycetota bacterium]
MFNLGGTEMLVILVVLLLIFGSRLPSIMRSLGRSATEFKKGMNDITEEPMTDQKSPPTTETNNHPHGDESPAG